LLDDRRTGRYYWLGMIVDNWLRLLIRRWSCGHGGNSLSLWQSVQYNVYIRLIVAVVSKPTKINNNCSVTSVRS